MNELDLIRGYFTHPPVARADVVLGVGDDGALLQPPPGQTLVVSTDTLVQGVHFPNDTAPEDIGHKALAVNLSDLAAMGAEPAWFTLNLTLPRPATDWLAGFSQGLHAQARDHGVQLVGGDTTRGPLSITVTVLGFAPPGAALRRRGARAGDSIYVTGTLGDAALGLMCLQGGIDLPAAHRAAVLKRLHRPQARVPEGLALRPLVSACIDISDGLLADLGHILEASGVGARVALPRLPLSPAYRGALPGLGWSPALTGGDDYELCFTVPAAHRQEAEAALGDPLAGCTRIGAIEAAPGLRVVDEAGAPVEAPRRGFDHFGGSDGP